MNKKIKVIVDGVELEVSVSEEELAKLTEKKQKNTGYERVYKGQRYFCVDGSDVVETITDDNDNFNVTHFKNANYYNDNTLAENNARADKLLRQLRRFAAENCEEVPWDDNSDHWYIRHDMSGGGLCVDIVTFSKDFGAIYFDTKENAQKAIDTFKDELIWYFTEYRDRV